MCMKTGTWAKDRTNHEVFSYNGQNYTYDKMYNLIKDLDYHKSGEDCDWNIIRVHDLVRDRDCYCVVFQESDSKADWLHNFNFLPCRVKAYKGWKHRLIYHKGFYDEWQSARDEIKSYLSPLLTDLANEQGCGVNELILYVIGWSLGGAISVIASEDFHEMYGMKPIMIAFEGANPCESYHTRNYIQSVLDEESTSFVYSNDFVCRCPPFFGKILKKTVYYLNDHKCKFPFYLFRKLLSFIIDTYHYHTSADEGILKYMPQETAE